MFITRMHSDKIAEELLAEPRSPQDAYDYAIRRKKGIEHSKTMIPNPLDQSTSSAIKQKPMGYIQPRGRGGQMQNTNKNRARYLRGRQNYPRGNQSRSLQNQNKMQQKQCYNCGKTFGPNHLQPCQAKDKVYAKCQNRGHFTKVCRSANVNFSKKLQRRATNGRRPSSGVEENDQVAFAELTSRNTWEELQRANFSLLSINESFEIKTSAEITDEGLNGHIVKLKTKSEPIFPIADSGSPKSFLNETTARPLQQNDSSTVFKYIPRKMPHEI